MKIILKQYNWDKKEEEVIGDVDTYTLSRSMGIEEMASLLSQWANAGGKDYRVGLELGRKFHNDHRTLQGLVARIALGIIVGIGEQEWTDPRNEAVVKMGKDIKRMIDEGVLKMGWMI